MSGPDDTDGEGTGAGRGSARRGRRRNAGRPQGSIARGSDIAWILTRHGVHHLGAVVRDRHRGVRPEVPQGAVELREALEDLGPTYVKLGQLLSTRGDLLPDGYATELARLQDQVRPIPPEVVHQVVRAEGGAGVDELYVHFEDEPLAAASIGQVHAATWADAEGVEHDVVVKVRRPDVAGLVDADLHLLTRVAELVARTSPHARQQLDPEGLAAEFGASLRRECDFRSEASIAQALRERFGTTDLAVGIPRIVAERSTSGVLTMSRVRGVALSELTAEQVDDESLAPLAREYADAFMAMVFSFGLFHADPHPGNVFVQDDGSIVLIDFGKFGRIDDALRAALTRLLTALALHDPDQIVDALGAMEVTSEGPTDHDGLRDDVVALVVAHGSEDLATLDVGAVLSEMLAIIRRHRLRMPPDLMLLLATVVMCEGVAAELDPSFQLQPVVLRWIGQGGFGASS